MFRTSAAKEGALVAALALVVVLLGVGGSASAAGSASALQLNGSSQYVTFGAAPGLGAATFTLETWFKRTGAGIGTSTGSGGIASAIPLVTKGRAEAEGSNVDMNYFLGIDATSGKLVADFEEGPSTGGTLGLNHPLTGTTAVTSNVWHHAAATYDGTTWKLYLDGALDGTLTLSAPRPPRSDSIQHAALGTAMNSTGVAAGFFQGTLDEARVWNYARSQAQIDQAMSLEITSASGLLGRWGLNDGSGSSVADSSGNGNNGTAVNSPTWTEGLLPAAQAAPANYGLDLNGSSSYVTFGAAPALGAATFTLETWFKQTGAGLATSTGTGGVTAIPLVTKGRAEAEGSNVDMNYFLGIDSTTGKLVADFEDMAAGTNHPVTGQTAVSQGAWHHAAATYDGTTWKLYLDGAPDGQLAVGQPPRSDSIQHAALGTAMTSMGVAAGFFQGTLDEARVWNYARSEAQIDQAMSQEITSASGLIGRWGLNEGSGISVADSSGNGITGTAFNTTWVAGAPVSTPDTTPPAQPQGLAATAGVQQVTLSWTANTEPDLFGYNLYRSTSSPVPTTGTPVNGGAPITGTSYVDGGLTAGTTYYYALRAVDTSGNSSTPSAEASATAQAPPPTATALSFDGSSQYVTFGAAPSLGASRFTLETWFERTGAGVGTNTGNGGIASAIPLLTKGRAEAEGSNVDMNYFLGIDATSGKLVADFEDMATGGNHPVSGQTVVSQNAWHHAVAAYDGAYWRLYLDGVLDAKLAVVAEPRSDSIQHAALATAMNSTGVAAGFFQGWIDEARIWSYARSGSEIRAARSSEISAAPGLVGRYGLNEGSGTTVSNSAGTAGGTTGGSPSWVAGYGFPSDTTAPAPPTGLGATAGVQQVSLSWTANAEPDLAGYNLYRSTTQGVDTSGTPLNGADLVQGTTFTDTGLGNGTTYYYALVAVDSSDNRSAVSGEVNATPAPPPPSAYALSLNGSSQYVTFGAAPSLGASRFTLETWFKRTGAGVGTSTGSGGIASAIPLVTKGRAEADGSNLDMNYFLGIDSASGKLVADFEDMATGGNHPVSGQTVVSQNAWHHAVASYDGAYWRLYLDGVLDAKVAVGAEPRADSIQHAALATAMTSTGVAAGFLQGVIDEARIWNYARSGSQIRAARNSEIASAAGLIGRFGLNEGSGATVTNSAGAANGTAVGSPSWVAGYDFPADATAPASPAGLAAMPEAGSITLSWTANGEADVAGYDVYRSTSSPVDTSGTPLNGGDLAQGTSYTDSGVALGTTYHYVLVAVDSSDNRSGASDEASATPQPGDPVFVGAGDIASCTSSGDEATANLLDGIQGSVFTIGDNVYQNGLLSEFNSCYDPTWGRQKSRTRPTPGNHDYGNGTNNGGGYFDYYNGTGNFTGPAGDRDKGYYSYDIGDYWHVVVLNTECGIDASCSLASQEQWLRSDLTANASKNVIALWHRPRWSSGPTRPGDSRFQGLWQDLYDHGVELLLVGHDHQYERFAPQNGSGQLDTTHGVREIIVGTGGDDLSGVGAPVANSQVLNNVTWGVLKLTLHRSSFDWRFIPVAGSSFTDSGTDPVHDAPANAPPTATVSLDTSAPQTNDALTATATKSDAEGQPVTLTYVWKVNGVVKRTYTSATALTDSFDLATAGNGDRGDVVSIEVTPNDGIADGATAAASATVANADPVFGQDLGDRSDLEGTPVSFSAGASDADLEPLVYEATGLPPGITIDASSGAISGTIAADAAGASPYDVAITVRDGAAVDATDTFTWTVTHANRAPLVDSAAIDQAAPRTNDTLTVTVQAHDPDGDPLDYGYQWTKNGTAIVGATSPSLDLSTAGNGDKGDQIAVTVSASDGQTTSTPLTTTPVTVANTPPSATVALDNSSPQTNAVLTATATKSDADGDPVSLTFVWKTDGVVKRTNTSATALTDTFDLSVTGNGDPGQTVTVEVTPNDGQAGGAVASDSALVAADTTPPSAPSGLVSSVSSTAVTLDWADNTEADLAGYDVYRSGTSGGPYVKLNSALLTSSTYRDPGAPAAATSYYVVEASDTSGNASQPSAELAVDRGIAFRAAATGLANSAATLTLPRPAGTQNADLLLATIDVLGTAAPSIPAGWTLLRSDSAGSTLDQRIYLHVAGGAEPASYTWTFAGTQNASGVVVAYVGADVTAPVDATSGASSTSAATATAPSLTTTVANALLVGTFGAAASATVAPPAGMLEQAEIVGGGGGKRTVTELADQPAPLVGATGSRSATLSKAAANVGQLVALRPAGSPPPAQTAPGAPQEVTATAGNGTVHVAWTPPTSDGGIPITNYRVYRGTASGAETLLTTVGVVTTWDDTTAANGTTYYYEVAAVNAVGTGPLSSEASATPVAATPGAPASLTAALKGKTISLSWAAPASNGGAAIAGYRIYRGTASGGESLLTTVGNVTTYKDAGVTSGQTYYYYVTAVNSAGEGARSVEASATVR